MTLQSLREFLAGIDSDYTELVSKVYPEYQSLRELAAADPASLQKLGIRAGIVGVIIQAAKGASSPSATRAARHDLSLGSMRIASS